MQNIYLEVEMDEGAEVVRRVGDVAQGSKRCHRAILLGARDKGRQGGEGGEDVREWDSMLSSTR